MAPTCYIQELELVGAKPALKKLPQGVSKMQPSDSQEFPVERGYGQLEATILSGKIEALLRSGRKVDKEIVQALESLMRSTELIRRLDGVLKSREAKLDSVRAEFLSIQELSTLTGPQGEAVVESLKRTLGKSALKERIWAVLINLAVGLFLFVVGVGASDFVKELLHLS